MATWVIEDDCLTPERYIRIIYKGPNPFAAYQATFNIFRKIVQIDPADYRERDFRWDISGDPRGFYIRALIEKSMDARTKIVFEVIFQGNQPSDPSKNGELTILIYPRMRTEYKLDSQFQQSPFYKALLWLYNFFFYFRVRRGYLKICNDWVTQLSKEYRELLKIG
jgi:hypothetical protein